MRKILPVLLIIILFTCLFVTFITIPLQAGRIYGPPASWLTISQRVQYSARLLWYDGLLNPNGNERNFKISPGDSVGSIASSLQEAGLIRDADSFRAYLIYSGLDTTVQAGEYRLSAAMSAIDVAREIQDATSTQVEFVVLPGWRMEEIAASLPTSGLAITPEEFLDEAQNPPDGFDFLEGASSTEGFLSPDSYRFSRNFSVDDLVKELVRNFGRGLTPDLLGGFQAEGLSIYEAVTLASIVEREAVRDEEKPLIASVYLNRLAIGTKLEADPTVQYALGFNSFQNTWWTNPLNLADLDFDSPYNTYVYAGLPPAPIANPGLDSLQAVAFPAQTTYYFFRARCDGSGYHSFAETFEEHVANGCP
jgi:UPF0755 protein